jgi:flagellar biosynthesis/type III secretory pathway protein FliH
MVDREGVVSGADGIGSPPSPEWVLAQGVVGWIPDEQAAPVADLESRVAELEARRSELMAERDAAYREGLARGIEQAGEAITALSAAFSAARETTIARAARASITAARELAGTAIGARPERVVDRIATLVAGEGVTPERVRVAPGLVPALERVLPSEIPVEGDGSVSVGDAVIEFPHGKVEHSLAEVLARWSVVIEESVRGVDD